MGGMRAACHATRGVHARASAVDRGPSPYKSPCNTNGLRSASGFDGPAWNSDRGFGPEMGLAVDPPLPRPNVGTTFGGPDADPIPGTQMEIGVAPDGASLICTDNLCRGFAA